MALIYTKSFDPRRGVQSRAWLREQERERARRWSRQTRDAPPVPAPKPKPSAAVAPRFAPPDLGDRYACVPPAGLPRREPSTDDGSDEETC